MRDPALVFVAELPRPRDARHAEHDRRQIVDARVVADVLVRRTLRAAVGRVKIEPLRFLHALKRRSHARYRCRPPPPERPRASRKPCSSTYTARRAFAGQPRRFEHVERAQRVHFEVRRGIVERRRHRDLRGQMVDLASHLARRNRTPRRPARRPHQLEPVLSGRLPARPDCAAHRAARGYRTRDMRASVGEQALGQVRSHEACATRNQNRIPALLAVMQGSLRGMAVNVRTKSRRSSP